MNTQLIAFENAPKLPAKKTAVANAFAAIKGSGGYPIISIKGKVFHVVRGDERTLITKPDAPDEPAAALEVVILAVGSGKAKVYYPGGYVEGSTDKPVCMSNDGVAPDSSATEPQAKKCALCPHNQWGSKITDNGKKTRACSDSLRMAVAPRGDLKDPMLLRVPAGSFAALTVFGDKIARYGYQPHEIVTKIGFDYTVAHQALTFKELGIIPADSDMAKEVAEARQLDIVRQITGEAQVEVTHDAEFENTATPTAPAELEAPAKVEEGVTEAAPAPKVEKAKPKPETKAKPAPEIDLPAAPKARVAVEAADEVGEMVGSDVDDLDFDD